MDSENPLFNLLIFQTCCNTPTLDILTHSLCSATSVSHRRDYNYGFGICNSIQSNAEGDLNIRIPDSQRDRRCDLLVDSIPESMKLQWGNKMCLDLDELGSVLGMVSFGKDMALLEVQAPLQMLAVYDFGT